MTNPNPEASILSTIQESAFDGNKESDFVNKTDKEIWKAFKSGSEVAFIYIYRTYFNTLYRYASQFCRDRDTIKDAIQDLFIELLNKRNKLSDTTSIKFYLFKSIKINLISKFKVRKIDYYSEIKGFDFGFSMSVEEVIINQQLDEDKKKRIADALQKLRRKQREIIYYYYFENLTFPEIASLLNFSNPKSAQNLLYSALTLLKENLAITFLLLRFIFR